MVEAQLSARAQQIFNWINTESEEIPLRQQALAELLGCSRRSVGRALNELKKAGLLLDLGKRHSNRCKLYKVQAPIKKLEPSPRGEQFVKLYPHIFDGVFNNWPSWEKHYPQVTWEFEHEKNIHVYWRQVFDRLYMIRDREREETRKIDLPNVYA